MRNAVSCRLETPIPGYCSADSGRNRRQVVTRSNTYQWRRLSIVGCLIVTCLVVAACVSSAPERIIDFDTVETPAFKSGTSTGSDGVFRLAVAPVYSPQTTLKLYRVLAEYLGRRLERPVELVQGKTYDEINDLIRAGGVTLAIVCTNAYLEGQEDFGLEALVIPQIHGQTVYYSYLIVPAGSPARTLADLRGKTFAFSDPLSNSGRLVPVYYLEQMGETPETFFSRTIFTYSHDNSVRAVMEKLVDGAAVDSLVYDFMAERDPDVRRKTHILARWGPFGINPIVVQPQLDPELKAELRHIFLAMHQDAEGQEVLAALGVERFLPPDATSYESVRMMREQVRGQP
ncbi:MAG: phosphate/phosphite/phosphonate ABC transporter substrate-binding protein [Chloroflexi bacterium]|nr:MAG: phosphate/phosphite/phosphonate ABC transporter substrate-binding protein [Chloroflexota bacterium]